MQEIEQLIEELQEYTEKQKELSYIAIINASKSTKRLGIICLLLFVIEVLLCIINSKVTVWVLISMSICIGTAIFNFYSSAKLTKQAQEYQNDDN